MLQRNAEAETCRLDVLNQRSVREENVMQHKCVLVMCACTLSSWPKVCPADVGTPEPFHTLASGSDPLKRLARTKTNSSTVPHLSLTHVNADPGTSEQLLLQRPANVADSFRCGERGFWEAAQVEEL